MLDENQKLEKPEGARTLPAALERFKWVPGQSGNSKGPTPMPKELRKAFRSYSYIALNCLLDCLTCEDHAVRLRAAEAILTRGFGRGEAVIPEDQETPPGGSGGSPVSLEPLEQRRMEGVDHAQGQPENLVSESRGAGGGGRRRLTA